MPESIPSFGPNEKLPEPYLLPENTIIAQDGLFKTNLSSGWVALPPKVVGPGGVARLLGISATGAAIFSPARPTAVTATPGVLEASVAFTAPVDSGGSSVIDYLVSAVPPGNYGSYTTTTSPVVVQGLLAQSYRFVVQARNEAGLSDRSVASSPIAVLATAPPPAPPASWAGIADADALAFGNTIIPRLGVKMHTTSAVTVTKVRARIDPVGATSITPTVGLASSLDASGVPTYISPVTGPASATVLANNWVEVTLTTPIALASGAVFYVLWDSTAGQIYGDAGGPAYTSAFQGAAVPELVVFDGSSNAQWGGSTDVYRIAMQVYAG